VLLASCGDGAVGDTAAIVNDEKISRDQVLALRTTYDDATAVDAGCGAIQGGECLQDFRGDLTQLVVAEALRSAAESEFGLTWTAEEIADRAENPPERYAPLFDPDRLPPYFTAEALQVQALFTLIRDGVAAELLLASPGFPDVYLEEPQRVTRACVRHVLVNDEDTAAEVLARAEAGEDLGALAEEFSTDTTTSGGLLLDPSGQCPVFLSGFVPPFALAAVTAPVGVVSGPVETSFGFHVILVEERVGPPSRDELIDDPIAWLEPAVASELYSEWLNVALQEASIEVHPVIGTWASIADGIRPPPSS
jgi:parvulin-like peptidyl-prolyl isomerase